MTFLYTRKGAISINFIIAPLIAHCLDRKLLKEIRNKMNIFTLFTYFSSKLIPSDEIPGKIVKTNNLIFVIFKVRRIR